VNEGGADALGSCEGRRRPASAALYGPRAPLVDALVIGRRSAMDRDLRDAFAVSGLVHLLSISGSTWACSRLGGAHRASAACATGTALALGAALATATSLSGWQAPAVRAVALLWVLVMLRMRQRASIPTRCSP
jgi:predicted membrane metal-binding protein